MTAIKESWKASAENTIRDVDISSSGGYTAAGSYDKHVYYYDKRGNLLWKYKAGDSVRDVAVSFNGRFVAAGSYDHNIYFFNRKGELLWKYKTGGEIRDLAISGEGRFVASVSNDHHVYFFNKEGEMLWKYKTRDKALCLSMSLRGDFVAAGSFDNNTYFFDREGNLLWKFPTHSTVLDVEISSKGRYIAVGSQDRYLYYLNKKGELLWKYLSPFPVEKVAISPNGRYVAIGIEGSVSYFNGDGVKLWEKPVGEFEVTGLEFSVFGESVIIGTQGGQLLFCDKRGRNLWKYTLSSPVEKANISANGRYIVSGHTDGKLLFFDGLDFFKKIFNNARESALLLRNYGIDSPEVSEHIRLSKEFYQKKQYLDSMDHALRAKVLAKEAIRTYIPEISVEIIVEKKLTYLQWSPILFELENVGRALAFDVRLDIQGEVMVRGDRSVFRKNMLDIYEKASVNLEIKPLKTKTLPLLVVVNYINFGGRRFTKSVRTHLYVHPPKHLEDVEYETTTPFEKNLIKEEKTLLSKERKELMNLGELELESSYYPHSLSPKERIIFRCPNCNREIKQEWLACPFCGTWLK